MTGKTLAPPTAIRAQEHCTCDTHRACHPGKISLDLFDAIDTARCHTSPTANTRLKQGFEYACASPPLAVNLYAKGDIGRYRDCSMCAPVPATYNALIDAGGPDVRILGQG